MCNGQGHVRNTNALCDFGCAPMKTNRGSSPRLANYFNFQPVHALADACSQGFRAGFLCSESSGKALCRVALAQAIGLLGRGKYAIEEALPEALRGLLNALNFNQVDAAADDHPELQPNISLRGAKHPAFSTVQVSHTKMTCQRNADNPGVRQALTFRDPLQPGAIPWALQMRAISREEPGRLVKLVTGAILGCGGWVLSRTASETGLIDILFEFERRACLEIYTVLIAAGLELSQAAHLRFTELCQCTRLGREERAEEIVSIDLEVQTFPLGESRDPAPLPH